jgi:hypothetical protein
MSETLTQVIDPAVLCKPALPSADDFSGADALLKSQAGSLNFSCSLNHLFEPSNNVVFNAMDDLGANLASPPTEGSNSLYLHGNTQIVWSMIDLEPIADASPQQVNYTSTFNLPMEVCATGNDGMVPTVGPSKLTLPTPVSGPSSAQDLPPDLPQDLPQDPQSKASPKRRGRKRKKPLSPAAEQLKREKFLERNRIAASRCREKKKKYIGRVEERTVELRRTNVRLRAEKEYLVKEIGSMTEVLLGCGSCACREHGIRLVKESGAWAHDEIEDSDILTEKSSIFSSDKE